MNKSKIEWTEFTSNPVTGKCPVDCSYCYVKPLRKRFGWSDEIKFHPKELFNIERRKKPASIFMGSTIELFHEQTIEYMPDILHTVKLCPEHTFQFLTKCPQNLERFNPWPDNAWVGVSATDFDSTDNAIDYLEDIEARIKYLSFEPLLKEIPIPVSGFGVNWIIIGAQTNPYNPPKIDWVREIVQAADQAGIKVFLKDNLSQLIYNQSSLYDITWAIDGKYKLRQELPE